MKRKKKGKNKVISIFAQKKDKSYSICTKTQDYHLDFKVTSQDKVIARSMVKKLPFKQRKAVTLRFWHNKSIFEIAKALRMTWGEADNLLKDALLQLKDNCICLLYTSPSPRDRQKSRMPSSA